MGRAGCPKPACENCTPEYALSGVEIDIKDAPVPEAPAAPTNYTVTVRITNNPPPGNFIYVLRSANPKGAFNDQSSGAINLTQHTFTIPVPSQNIQLFVAVYISTENGCTHGVEKNHTINLPGR